MMSLCTFDACIIPMAVHLCHLAWADHLSSEVDWAQARRSGLLEVFVAEVQAGLAPLLNNAYEDAEQ